MKVRRKVIAVYPSALLSVHAEWKGRLSGPLTIKGLCLGLRVGHTSANAWAIEYTEGAWSERAPLTKMSLVRDERRIRPSF